MPHAHRADICDADTHIMERPDWIAGFADPDVWPHRKGWHGLGADARMLGTAYVPLGTGPEMARAILDEVIAAGFRACLPAA